MPSTLVHENLRLCEILPDELGEVAQFIARQRLNSDPGLNVQQLAARLHWIVLENPARDSGMPLGWCARNAKGALAGCMCCAPQKFLFQGKAITLMMSSSFYVDEQHRGVGVSIFMRFLQLGKRYPLFASSANATVAEMWKKLGAFPVGESDHEMLGIRRWRGVVEESLVRRLGNNSFTRVMTAAASAVLRVAKGPQMGNALAELRRVESPTQAAALCATETPRLTSLRDAAYLQWRYFSEVDSTTRLFAFRAAGAANEYMIAINLRQRGYRGQIRSANVLDVFPEPKPEIYPAIANALVREYRIAADVIVFRCLNEDGQHAMRRRGFVRRQFAAPIAWCLDKFQNLPSHDWYFVPADGDMLL